MILDIKKLFPDGYVVTDFKTIFLDDEHNSHYHTFSVTPSAGGSHVHTSPSLNSMNCGSGYTHGHNSGGNSSATTHTHVFSGNTSTESAVDTNHTHAVNITSASEASHTHVPASPASGGCDFWVPAEQWPCSSIPHSHTIYEFCGAGTSHTHSLSGNTGTGSGTLQAHTHSISLTSAAGGSHNHASPDSTTNSCHVSSHYHSASNYGNEATHTHTVSGNTASGGEAAAAGRSFGYIIG